MYTRQTKYTSTLSLLLTYRKEYPVISKSMVRQRLISTHSHLAGKLGAGVLAGHPQVLSSYQYDTGVPLSNPDSQDPISTHFPQSRDPNLLYHCFKHRGLFCWWVCNITLAAIAINCSFLCNNIADNGRHLELGCKRSYLETSTAVSDEHYFRSPPSYESPLLSHPYRTEAIASREACMYGGMETESGSGAADADDLTNSPSINCNMWATVQPYPRYGMEGVPYQPFTAHFTNSATVAPVVPHPASSVVSRPQADLGVYNSAAVQRGLPVIPPSTSSSSSSPSFPGSRDSSGHPHLYHRKPGSPLLPHRDFSSYSAQGTISIREPAYQYQVGLSSTASNWTDS